MKPFLFLQLFIFITVLLACTKDETELSNADKIIGTWYQEEIIPENNRISRFEYTFDDDGTAKALRIEMRMNNREILGYTYRSNGKYLLKGDSLSLLIDSVFVNNNPDKEYTELENLAHYATEYNFSTITVRFIGLNKMLFIYPPCGPTENCVGNQTFIRE